MAKTRFKATMYLQDLNVSAAISVSSMAVDTTFTPPAQSVDLGTASNLDATSKLNGVYLSYNLDGGASATITHGLGQVVKGWWIVKAPVSSERVVYCEDISLATAELTLVAGTNSTGAFTVFAF